MVKSRLRASSSSVRSEERRVGKECTYRRTTAQAEDGIRDGHVTGVQTCALPISDGAQDPHRILPHADVRLADGVDEPRREVRLSTHVIDHPRGVDLVEERVDGEVAPARVLLLGEIGRASCRERVYV